MEIRYSKIFVIHNDIPDAMVSDIAESVAVQDYIRTITNELASNPNTRSYDFVEDSITAKSETEFIIAKVNALSNHGIEDERRSTIDGELLNYIVGHSAGRLARIEKEHNDKSPIGKIPRGVLIITEIEDEDCHKLIFAKADYSEFVEEQTGENKSGLPTKKKIYKAVSIQYTLNEARAVVPVEILVCDTTGNKNAQYWCKTFLELREHRTDEVNTDRAFKAIKVKAINPLRDKFKSDYVLLHNILVSFFTRREDFRIEDFIQELNVYNPIDQTLNKADLIEKVQNLPQKEKFDSSFPINAQCIKDKMISQSVRLGNNLNLNITGSVDGLHEIVVADTDEIGRKFVKIFSDEGYQYFKRDNL